MLESAFTIKVKKRLVAYGVVAFKIAGTARQRAGIPDILGVLPDGRMLAIELKAPGKYETAWAGCTKLQLKTLETIHNNNGLAFASDSLADIEEVLTLHGYSEGDTGELYCFAKAKINQPSTNVVDSTDFRVLYEN